MAFIIAYLTFSIVVLVQSADKSVLTENKICFNAKKSNLSSEFYAPKEGTITGFQLNRINGIFNCSTNPTNEYFGCSSFPFALYGNFNVLYYPTNATYSCSISTNKISSKNPSYKVHRNYSFVLKISERCCNNTNVDIPTGVVCASVYFMYKQNEDTIVDMVQSHMIEVCAIVGAILLFVMVFIYIRCCRKSKKRRIRNKELRNNLLNQEMTTLNIENSKPEGIEKKTRTKKNYLSVNHLKPEGVEISNISENSELLYENPDVDGYNTNKTTTGLETIAIEYKERKESIDSDYDVLYEKPLKTTTGGNLKSKEGIKSRKPSEFANDEMSDGHKRTDTNDSMDDNTM